MAKRNYIDFDKDEVPIVFDIDLEEATFTVGINYNLTNDFFTIDLWDGAGDVIVLGEKMTLNVPLFSDLVDVRLPGPLIIPMDESGVEKRITFDNMGVTVFLFIDDIGEETDGPDPEEYTTNNDNLNGDDNYGI